MVILNKTQSNQQKAYGFRICGPRPRKRRVGTEIVDGKEVPVYRCESPAELYLRLHGPKRAKWDKRSPERVIGPGEE